MELEFKADFDRTRTAWRRFWAGTLNRPLVLAEVARPGMTPVPAPDWGAALSHNHEAVVDQALRWAESHEFLGDTVPFFTPSLMPSFFAALLGAEITQHREAWGTDTAVIPFVDDLDTAEVKLRFDSPWWEKWVDFCACIKRKCAGRLVFGEATPGYNLDVLGDIRGTERLMLDFYDNPAGVHRALGGIFDAYQRLIGEYRKLFEFETYGGVTRHGFYCDGVIGVPQCDFGFNIGKEHFDEFALPYLKKEIALLDAVEYHLDGPRNITHVESLCAIEKIGVFQWVPGAGNEHRDWTPLYDRIHGLGKGMWFWPGSPEEAKRLWGKYGDVGRMILSVRADTRAEVEAYQRLFDA